MTFLDSYFPKTVEGFFQANQALAHHAEYVGTYKSANVYAVKGDHIPLMIHAEVRAITQALRGHSVYGA